MTAAVRDEESAQFFDAAASGRLLLLKCANCGQHSAPYGLGANHVCVCAKCHGSRLEGIDARGTGKLVSWIITHSKPDASGVTEQNPVAMVELDEGPWLLGRFVGDPAVLAMGRRLRPSSPCSST